MQQYTSQILSESQEQFLRDLPLRVDGEIEVLFEIAAEQSKMLAPLEKRRPAARGADKSY